VADRKRTARPLVVVVRQAEGIPRQLGHRSRERRYGRLRRAAERH
jgi:hypothetical protein